MIDLRAVGQLQSIVYRPLPFRVVFVPLILPPVLKLFSGGMYVPTHGFKSLEECVGGEMAERVSENTRVGGKGRETKKKKKKKKTPKRGRELELELGNFMLQGL